MSSLVLVLTDDKLFAYRHRRRNVELIGEVSLDNGLEAFLNNLYKKYRAYCCRLILDRSDEEFVLESLPALGAAMRKRAIGIKLTRHFTSTAFTVGEAATNNRVLCAGIENKNSLYKFMQAVEKQGIVFSAIYSLAILLAHQCKSAQIETDTTLVISSHQGKVWRYSLAKAGKLLLSRCVFIGDTENKWSEIVAELESTQTYANRILKGQDKITTVYAGQDVRAGDSIAGKFITSLQRQYRLFDLCELYKGIINNSRGFSRYSSYKSKHTSRAYYRYLAANVSIFASVILFITAVLHFYNADQHNTRITFKTLALQRDLRVADGEVSTIESTSALTNLTTDELQKVVEVFAAINLNDEAGELKFRLASVLSIHPDIGLSEISFARESIGSKPGSSKEQRTVLSAKLLYSGSSVFATEVARFLEALENNKLHIVQSSRFETQIRNKGMLGVSDEEGNSDLPEFSLTITLRENA